MLNEAMIYGYVYLALLLTTFAFVGMFGEAMERCALAVIALGSVATRLVLVGQNGPWHRVEQTVLLIDCIALIAFMLISLRSKRFWPLWITAFQLIVVVAHAAKSLYPNVIPPAYAIGESMWATFQIALLGLVSANIRRQRSEALTNPYLHN